MIASSKKQVLRHDFGFAIMGQVSKENVAIIRINVEKKSNIFVTLLNAEENNSGKIGYLSYNQAMPRNSLYTMRFQKIQRNVEEKQMMSRDFQMVHYMQLVASQSMATDFKNHLSFFTFSFLVSINSFLAFKTHCFRRSN